jgi:hypothetical protein
MFHKEHLITPSQKFYIPPYPLCPWEGRVLPTATPPHLAKVGVSPHSMFNLANSIKHN